MQPGARTQGRKTAGAAVATAVASPAGAAESAMAVSRVASGGAASAPAASLQASQGGGGGVASAPGAASAASAAAAGTPSCAPSARGCSGAATGAADGESAPPASSGFHAGGGGAGEAVSDASALRLRPLSVVRPPRACDVLDASGVTGPGAPPLGGAAPDGEDEVLVAQLLARPLPQLSSTPSRDGGLACRRPRSLAGGELIVQRGGVPGGLRRGTPRPLGVLVWPSQPESLGETASAVFTAGWKYLASLPPGLTLRLGCYLLRDLPLVLNRLAWQAARGHTRPAEP